MSKLEEDAEGTKASPLKEDRIESGELSVPSPSSPTKEDPAPPSSESAKPKSPSREGGARKRQKLDGGLRAFQFAPEAPRNTTQYLIGMSFIHLYSSLSFLLCSFSDSYSP